MADVAVGSTQPPGRPRLEDVDWQIWPGDYWVVGGGAGSGKSDLLTTLAGVMPPLRGTLRLFGVDRSSAGEADWSAARLRVGLVFEGGGRLFAQLSARDNIALGLCYHSNCRPADVADEVNRLLDFAGLTSVAHLTPGRLEFVARQRLALARAMALRPEALLLDNPLSGLGPSEAGWWLDTLARLAGGVEWLDGRPMTLVATCNDFRPWEHPSGKFAFLSQGRLLELGNRWNLASAAVPGLEVLMPRRDITEMD